MLSKLTIARQFLVIDHVLSKRVVSTFALGCESFSLFFFLLMLLLFLPISRPQLPHLFQLSGHLCRLPPRRAASSSGRAPGFPSGPSALESGGPGRAASAKGDLPAGGGRWLEEEQCGGGQEKPATTLVLFWGGWSQQLTTTGNCLVPFEGWSRALYGSRCLWCFKQVFEGVY